MHNNRPRHIALITCDDIFAAGGVADSVVRIARGLSMNYDLQVDILMLLSGEYTTFKPQGYNGITRLEQHIDGVTIFRLTPWTGGTSSPQNWVDIHYALLELAKERHYDLLHAFYASIAGFPTVYAARELQLPSVVSIRGNDINRDVFHTARFHHLKWALENATAVTAVSQEGLQRARIVTACQHKGTVILNSIRPEDFAEGIVDPSLPRPTIGSVAVFKNKKGLEVLLCAFSMLLQQYPGAHLLMVGYIIPTEQGRFEELVAKYDLAGKFTLTGQVPGQDILRYIRAMDVFAFSSLHDGCPNSILEAMLAAAPIVATRCGAVPQMIENEQEGLLVPPGSATELHAALLKMLHEGNKRWAYGQKARARVLRDFVPQGESAAYMRVYKEVL